jgi:hypothetical protein
MNARIRQQFNFVAGLVYREHYVSNLYQLTLDMLTATDDADEQNVAYERIKYWVEDVLADSVLIQDSDPTLEAHRATGRRVHTLPEEPIDSVLGVMIYLKTNAIAENRMMVTEVALSSSEGRDVIYLHGSQEEEVEILTESGWWHESRPYCVDHKNRRKIDSNVIALDRMPEWADLGLEWETTQEKKSVVITSFTRDDDKK